jgi:hypothetical protein
VATPEYAPDRVEYCEGTFCLEIRHLVGCLSLSTLESYTQGDPQVLIDIVEGGSLS